jgi:hypothetical protein
VGSLRYLVHTRSDWAYSIGIVSRFMENPTTDAVKQILRYVQGTINLGCTYRKENEGLILHGYSHNDMAGDVDDRKSTTDIVFYYIQECIDEGMIEVQYMNTKDQLADILTKSLGREKFLEMWEKIEVRAVMREKDLKDNQPSTEEQVKVEDATKEKCCCQRKDEPTTVKMIPKMLRRTAKEMPTMRSSNRVWDPGRNEDVVFKGVNIRVNTDMSPNRTRLPNPTSVW